MTDQTVNGVWIEKHVKILDSEKLWQQFTIRLVYVDMTKNDCQRDVANTCAMQGFDWGGFTRLRYPPEEGSADSQAFDFAVAVKNTQYDRLPSLPPVLELRKGEPAFCETNMYRGMVETFIHSFKNYCGKKVIIKAAKNVIDWLTPSSTILSCDLWLHEPTNAVDYRPWTNYAFRSYSARDMLGTMAAPFYFPHDKAILDTYLKNGALPALPASFVMANSVSGSGGTGTGGGATQTMSDRQVLDAIYSWTLKHS